MNVFNHLDVNFVEDVVDNYLLYVELSHKYIVILYQIHYVVKNVYELLVLFFIL